MGMGLGIGAIYELWSKLLVSGRYLHSWGLYRILIRGLLGFYKEI